MLQGKKFGLNEEVIAKAEAYFENKDKSFYKKKNQRLVLSRNRMALSTVLLSMCQAGDFLSDVVYDEK